MTKTILETCGIWDIDYNSHNWEPEFMTISVTWQLRVTLESICNSCNVFQRACRITLWPPKHDLKEKNVCWFFCWGGSEGGKAKDHFSNIFWHPSLNSFCDVTVINCEEEKTIVITDLKISNSIPMWLFWCAITIPFVKNKLSVPFLERRTQQINWDTRWCISIKIHVWKIRNRMCKKGFLGCDGCFDYMTWCCLSWQNTHFSGNTKSDV